MAQVTRELANAYSDDFDFRLNGEPNAFEEGCPSYTVVELTANNYDDYKFSPDDVCAAAEGYLDLATPEVIEYDEDCGPAIGDIMIGDGSCTYHVIRRADYDAFVAAREVAI